MRTNCVFSTHNCKPTFPTPVYLIKHLEAETHKIRLHTDWCDQRLVKVNPPFPLEAIIQSSLTQCWRQLYRTQLPHATRTDCTCNIPIKNVEIVGTR